jgi:hypothetical protein
MPIVLALLKNSFTIRAIVEPKGIAPFDCTVPEGLEI